ncbi:hypothetical protein AB1339_27655 [Streptomyces cyaneofuscatus]|uniref:hypothetical protein n=1 Tax=Streptomyces cyaneofuscatus TaxID=66883 RepID=UPI00345DA40C
MYVVMAGEPLGLGTAIGMMMTERGVISLAVGGSVLADYDTILVAVVPELAGRVQAVASDAEIGRLDVVLDLPADGTQLRWSAPKLVAAANERVRGANVRTPRVLAPAPAKAGLHGGPPHRPRSRPHPPNRRGARIRRKSIAGPLPPTEPPGTTPGSTPALRSRRPPNGSSVNGSGNQRSLLKVP